MQYTFTGNTLLKISFLMCYFYIFI